MADKELRILEAPPPPHLLVGGVEVFDSDGTVGGKRVMTKVDETVTEYAAGEWQTGTYTGDRRAPTRDEIAQLAFSLYESRGREDGHDVEDWLRAEQELVRHYA